MSTAEPDRSDLEVKLYLRVAAECWDRWARANSGGDRRAAHRYAVLAVCYERCIEKWEDPRAYRQY